MLAIIAGTEGPPPLNCVQYVSVDKVLWATCAFGKLLLAERAHNKCQCVRGLVGLVGFDWTAAIRAKSIAETGGTLTS